MIVVVEQNNSHEHSHLLDQMFRLRARIFRDRLNWDVHVIDGKERDKYDDEGPVYIIYADDKTLEVKGAVYACCRQQVLRFWPSSFPIRSPTAPS